MQTTAFALSFCSHSDVTGFLAARFRNCAFVSVYFCDDALRRRGRAKLHHHPDYLRSIIVAIFLAFLKGISEGPVAGFFESEC